METGSEADDMSSTKAFLVSSLKKLTELHANKLITSTEKSSIKSLLLSAPKGVDERCEAVFRAGSSAAELADSLKHLVHAPTPRLAGSSFSGTPRMDPLNLSSLSHGHRGGARPILLYASREMQDVAERAAAQSSGSIQLGLIKWDRFDTPEGWPNLFIQGVHDVESSDVMFLASFHTPQVVFEQISVMYSLARYGARSLRIILPFFATGTMERVDRVGEVATAESLARLLSVIPHCAGGPTQLVIFDIHALQERFYFSDNVQIKLKSCVKLLSDTLKSLRDKDETIPVVIVFPDDGAFKRFHTKFELDFPLIVCHKVRDGERRKVDIRDGYEHVQNAHCVIVDDLVKSGGTLLECASVLERAGAKHVSAYCTHGVFPQDSWKKFAWATRDEERSPRFANFWITDSIPTTASAIQNVEPFRVLSIAPLLATLVPMMRDDGVYD